MKEILGDSKNLRTRNLRNIKILKFGMNKIFREPKALEPENLVNVRSFGGHQKPPAEGNWRLLNGRSRKKIEESRSFDVNSSHETKFHDEEFCFAKQNPILRSKMHKLPRKGFFNGESRRLSEFKTRE